MLKLCDCCFQESICINKKKKSFSIDEKSEILPLWLNNMCTLYTLNTPYEFKIFSNRRLTHFPIFLTWIFFLLIFNYHRGFAIGVQWNKQLIYWSYEHSWIFIGFIIWTIMKWVWTFYFTFHLTCKYLRIFFWKVIFCKYISFLYSQAIHALGED